MGVIVDEEYGTQIEKTRGEKTTIRRRFCVFADCDFDAYLQIRNFIVANYSESIESLSVTEDNETTRYWRGECTFSSPDPKDLLKEKGIPEYSFSTKGGSAHITQSRKTVKVYRGWRAKYEYVEEPDKKGNVTKKLQIVKDEHGNPVLEKETPKDYKGGIGWNDESASFDGTDIIVPSWKATVKITVPDELIDSNYLKMLRLMTGSVNKYPFDGMAVGECLFLGCDGSRNIKENEIEDEDKPDTELVWDLTFEFVGAPNRRTWVNNIGYVEKRGWEYMHLTRRIVNTPFLMDKEEIPPENNNNNNNNDYTTDSDDPETETDETGETKDKKTWSTPVAAYIEQVYPYADFRLLGFDNIINP